MASTPTSPQPQSPVSLQLNQEQQVHNNFLNILSQKSGGVLLSLDALRRKDALKEVSLTFPRIVAVGPESCGKSSVLERLVNASLFPRDEGICTRMPIELRCIHYTIEDLKEFCQANALPFSPKEFYSRLVLEQNGQQQEPTKYMPIAHLCKIVKKHHDDIVIRKNGSLTGIVADAVLVIEILGAKAQNLRLIDLPGIVQAHRIGEASDIAQQTIDLVKSYLQDDHTMVLAIVAATEGFRTSTAMRLVQEFKKEKQTIGVLTKADLTQDARAEAKADPFRRLKDKLDLVSGDMIDLSSGLVALRNHDTAYDRDVKLTEIKKRETAWFQEHLPDYVEKGQVGLTALAEKLVQMMLKYTEEKWVPNAVNAIEAAKAQKSEEMIRKFGQLPMTEEKSLGFLLDLCGLIVHDWAKLDLFNHYQWAYLFSLPQAWETPWSQLNHNDLTSLIAWRQFKKTLLDEGFIHDILSELLDGILGVGLRVFSQSYDTSVKLHRFDTLRKAMATLFFNLEITPEVMSMIRNQFSLLCSIYESLPQSRVELHERLSNALRSIVFEHVLFDNFERTSVNGLTTASDLSQALLSCFPLEELLREEETWANNRSQHNAIIRNLTEAHQAIDSMVASLGE